MLTCIPTTFLNTRSYDQAEHILSFNTSAHHKRWCVVQNTGPVITAYTVSQSHDMIEWIVIGHR